MNPQRPLSGHTGLITGAGRGIGAAIARALAAMGATVIATYRNDRAAAEELSVRLPAAIPRMLEALTPAG